MDHQYWMQQALEQAALAEAAGEVPIGAVLIKEGQCIARAFNQPISLLDPSAHAEIQVLRLAGQALGNYRLIDTTLYVTLEPCPMCASAMVHARINSCIFAAYDPKTGAAGSKMDLFSHPSCNHRVDVTGGVCADVAGERLRQFFRKLRKQQ